MGLGIAMYPPAQVEKVISPDSPLREGDVFTWLPLELPNEPGDTPLRLELRVTQTRFGPPEEAVLGLWPVMHSNLRGGL